jgi:hypothetical protein
MSNLLDPFSRRSVNGADGILRGSCASHRHEAGRAVRRTAAKRVLLIALLACTLAADEPPIRLQKKDRPQPERIPVLPKEVPPSADSEGVRLEQSIEETIARLTSNLEKTNQRLGQNDVGEGTRKIQRDVAVDFEALIEHMRQQQQQQETSQASSSPKRRSREDSQQQTAQNKPVAKPEPQDQQANTGQGGSSRSAEERRKLADLYRDVWGHLPETLRQQMDAYGREQFMPKYTEVLKQYFATLAEKGRQKGN